MVYNAETVTRVCLTAQGSNILPVLQFDVTELRAKWPEATFDIIFRRPGESEAQVYPVSTQLDGNILKWTVVTADVSKPGYGSCQIAATLADGHWYSKKITCEIRANIAGGSATNASTWVNDVLSAKNTATAASTSAATSAREAASSAMAASTLSSRAATAMSRAEIARTASESAKNSIDSTVAAFNTDYSTKSGALAEAIEGANAVTEAWTEDGGYKEQIQAATEAANDAAESVEGDIADIKSDISDLDEEVFTIVSSKNLWVERDTSDTSSGSTFLRDGSEYTFTMTVNGANKGHYFKTNIDLTDKVGQYITVSAEMVSHTTAGTPTMRLYLLDSDLNSIYGSTTYQKAFSSSGRTSNTIQITENAKVFQLGLTCGTSSSTAIGQQWTIKDIQVEFGSSATDYVEYGTTKESKIDLLTNRVESLEESADEECVVDTINPNDNMMCNGVYRSIYNPYKNVGSNQYKGQMHCHSTTNSGRQLSTMQQIYNNYKTRYDFMCLTDYNAYADLDRYDTLVQLNEADNDYNLIQLFKGYEAKVIGSGVVKQYHAIIYNTTQIVAFDEGTPVVDLAQIMTEKGCIVDFAHPSYSGYTDSDMDYISGLVRYTEVCNAGTLSETQWDKMLNNGNFVFGLGVSDCHGTSNSAIETSWIKVFANEKTRDSIYNALYDGCFYASNGATVSGIQVKDGSYKIYTQNQTDTVSFISDGVVVKTQTGSYVTYSFTGNEKYVRAKITNASGQCAWTQPVFICEQIGNDMCYDVGTVQEWEAYMTGGDE